jgi:hypothetical protein
MHLYLSDVEWLLVILAAVYLAECACWLRRKAVCFSLVVRRHYPLRWPSFLGNADAGLVFTNPLPWATAWVCEPWPLAISPEGICLPWGPASRFLPFESVRSARHEDREVRAGGVCLAETASAEHARRLAALLAEIAWAAPQQRRQLIEDKLGASTDVEAIAARVADLRKLARPLRIASVVFFVYAMGLGPLLYYGPFLSWRVLWIYLAGVPLAWLATVAEYLACRRAFLDEPRGRRWQHAAMLLLSPASAMRAAESLFRPGLAEFHPLAVAAVLSSKHTAAAMAKATLLELQNPLSGDLPADAAAGRVERWFRQRLLEDLGGALGQVGIDAAALVAPPAPLGDARSFCPRCRTQFVSAEGTCPDCGDMPLVPFGAREP